MFFELIDFLGWGWLVAFHFVVVGLLFFPLWVGLLQSIWASLQSWFDGRFHSKVEE